MAGSPSFQSLCMAVWQQFNILTLTKKTKMLISQNLKTILQIDQCSATFEVEESATGRRFPSARDVKKYSKNATDTNGLSTDMRM